jgi:eukaryotic-like serine/threonine-protein kinase
VLREGLAIQEKKQPDAWTTFNTQSILGVALLVQKKYADAEPLLRKGYEGLKQRAAQIPPQSKQVCLTRALERLVRLYDAWDRPEEAARWRKELEARTKAAEKAAKPREK